MNPAATPERLALIRSSPARIAAKRRADAKADALASHVERSPGRVRGTEFVEWTSELEEGRVPTVEGE